MESKNEELLEQTLELERECKKLRPLRSQLETAKEARCSSEVRTSELESQLREAKAQMAEMAEALDDLRAGASAGGAMGGSDLDALCSDAGGIPDDGVAGLGDGMTEYNPEVQAKIKRLEEENRILLEARDAEAPERV